MEELKPYRTPRGVAWGQVFSFDDIAPWHPTVAQIREAVWDDEAISGAMLGEPGQQFIATSDEVEAIADAARAAVDAGRVIECGHIPNALIKEGGTRGGPLYTMGAIGHPFRDPWMFTHTWEGIDEMAGHRPDPEVLARWRGAEKLVAVYLVQLIERDKPAGGMTEVVEFDCFMVGGRRRMIIGDRVHLDPDAVDPEHPDEVASAGHKFGSRYGCRVAPSAIKASAMLDLGMSIEDVIGTAAGNALDPLMAVLLMLNTRGVPQETIRASEKLQKARAKARKRPIPPYVKVHSADYITALSMRGRRTAGEPGGGHHASPIPHLRRGHIREYATGQRTFIRDTLVRVTPEAREAFLAGRSHYEVKP